jgi:hypothetical protein
MPLIMHHTGPQTQAKYVQVCLLDNPKVFGTMGLGETIYRGEIHAKLIHDMGPPAEYTHDNLQYLHADF